MKEVIKKTFTYTGSIWKILFSNFNNALVAEIRDGEERKVYFAFIRLHNNENNWTIAGPSWWTSLAAVSKNKILLHAYQDPKFPETKGLTVLNASDGKMVWKNSNWAYHTYIEDQLLVSDIENSDTGYFLVSTETGQVLKELDSGAVIEIFNSNKNQQHELVENPSFYPEDSEYFVQVAEFLSAMGKEVKKAIEYLEFSEKIIISYYLEQDSNIVNKLLILNGEGEELLEEVISQKSEGIGLGTFFVIKEQLVYVRDKKEIVILDLNRIP